MIGKFGLGDDDSKFVEFVGGSTLEAGDMTMNIIGCGCGEVTVYRSKDGSWMVISKKETKKILQIFYCGSNWKTNSGFGPKVGYSSYAAGFGEATCRFSMQVAHASGIGFDRTIRASFTESSGLTRVEQSYQCVTVFDPQKRDKCKFTSWTFD